MIDVYQYTFNLLIMTQFLFAYDSNLKPAAGQQVTLSGNGDTEVLGCNDLLIERALAGDDAIFDNNDNCPASHNTDQLDSDKGSIGNIWVVTNLVREIRPTDHAYNTCSDSFTMILSHVTNRLGMTANGDNKLT